MSFPGDPYFVNLCSNARAKTEKWIPWVISIHNVVFPCVTLLHMFEELMGRTVVQHPSQ